MTQPKALLLRLSSLGDIVLATAAAAPLREAGYSVSIVTKAEFAPLLLGQPDFAEVWAFDKKLGEACAKQALLSWAEAQEFSLVLDLQNSWRTWSWRSGFRKMGARVCVLAKPRFQEWLVLWLRMGKFAGLGAGGRALRFRNAALRALGKPLTVVSPTVLTRLEASPEALERVSNLLPAGDFAAILPVSAWKSKEWPYFPELAILLASRVPVVVLGGSRDDRWGEVWSAAAAKNSECRNLQGKTSLRESLAVLAKAKWVIGNDTGMVHVAEALGKPVAMLEGPTHPYLGFSPWRKESVAIGLPLVCRPCSKSGKVCLRFGSRLCLRGLGLEAVASQLRARGFPC